MKEDPDQIGKTVLCQKDRERALQLINIDQYPVYL